MSAESKQENALGSEAMDRYSRQIGTFGVKAQGRLMSMDVLIVGMTGLGVEAAKNLILAGPRSVKIFDNGAAAPADMNANFFITEVDVGTPRSVICAPKLQELNPGVDVGVLRDAAGADVPVTVSVAADETLASLSAKVAELTKLGEEQQAITYDGVVVDADGLGALRGKADVAFVVRDKGKRSAALTEELVSTFSVVLFATGSKAMLLKWNKFCREFKAQVKDGKAAVRTVPRPIGFIAANVYGLAAFAFTDFGNNHEMFDYNGEAPEVRVVVDITSEENGLVTLQPGPEGKRLTIEDSDHAGWVEFSNVQGCYAKDESALQKLGLSINHAGAWRINSKKPYSFRIGDTRQLSPYMGGGLVTQKKQPVAVQHRSLADVLQNPGDVAAQQLLNFSKWGRFQHLHIAVNAIGDFETAHAGLLPEPRNAAHMAEVVALAKKYNEAAKTMQASLGAGTTMSVEELDVKVVELVAKFAALEFQPVCCFMGGLVAQEVVKFTGKYTPLNQILHFDAFEVLPAEDPPAAETKAAGTRYDHTIGIFGKAFQDKVLNLKTYMVGCGALGCEHFKNFALLGIGCGPEGMITVTDNDVIEVSNLSRQFLFREDNVGQAKSMAASERAKVMNGDIKVTAHTLLAWPKSENVFHDKFWNSLDFVTTALDNVKAREYIDNQCIFYEKCMLDSATMGSSGEANVVLPHKTQTYTDGPKVGADATPMCTLRNFPSLMDHCIEWARAKFTDWFEAPCEKAMAFVENQKQFLADMKKDTSPSAIVGALAEMKAIKALLETRRDATFAKCVDLAQTLYFTWFHHNIRQLQRSFPKDHIIKKKNDAGEVIDEKKFWSGAKRFPQAEVLTLDDPVHLMFITCAANIYAANLGVVSNPEGSKNLLPRDHTYRKRETISKALSATTPPPLVYSTTKIATEGEAKDEAGDDERVEFDALLEELGKMDPAGLEVAAADFEKDQDLNFHIDFIASCANLRAKNYHIDQASRHAIKMKAGRIIPAIATTTAAMTGAIMLELFKFIQDKELSDYKNMSAALAVNQYQQMDPSEARKEADGMDMGLGEMVTCRPSGFTKWDKIRIEGDLTIEELAAEMKKVTDGLVLTELQHPASTQEKAPGAGMFLWEAEPISDSMEKVYQERGKKTVVDVIREVHGADAILPGRTWTELIPNLESEDGDLFKVPRCVYKFA